MSYLPLRRIAVPVTLTFLTFLAPDMGYTQFPDLFEKAKKGVTDTFKLPPTNQPGGGNKSTASPEQKDQKESDYSGVKKFSDMAGVGLFLGGSALCAKSGLNKNAKAVCVLGAMGAPAVSKALGESITKHLKEQDQRKALQAAREALRTGEPQTVQLPDSNAVLTITPTGPPVYKDVETDILVDKKNVRAVQKLKGVGSVYQAAQVVTVYPGPGTTLPGVDTVKAGEQVHVMGRLIDQPWFLVARMVAESENSYPAPMAFGFVSDNALVEMTTAALNHHQKPPSTMETLTVTAVVKCYTNANRLVVGNGQIAENGSAFECLGLDGSQLSQ